MQPLIRAAFVASMAILPTGAPSLAIVRAPRPIRAADVAIRAARMLDVETGAYRGPVVVLVSGARISKVVASADFKSADAATVIDLGDATLLPGLIDAHVHLQIAGSPADNALATLKAGFTTVADLGATSDAILQLRDSVARGTAVGPRILAAGLWIGVKNGICEFGGIGVDPNVTEFRRRVRDNVRAGADLIKVCVSGWPRAAFAEPAAYELPDSLLDASVDEAHRAHKLVLAHDISLGGVQAALRAHVDGLAHAAYLDSATAALVQQRGMFMIPTIASLAPAAAVGPPAMALRAAVQRAYRAGIRFVFGTDAGVIPHGAKSQEFDALVALGVSPIDAIRSATINAARALGLADSIGVIAAGKAADFVAVAGDPVKDITALANVRRVMRRGILVRLD